MKSVGFRIHPGCKRLCVSTLQGAAADVGPAEMLVEDEDIGDFMKEILAEEKKKKEELVAQLKREQEEQKRWG
jgi:DNA-binding phage protein